MTEVTVSLISTETEWIGQRELPAVPREGESVVYQDDLYVVRDVIWQDVDDDDDVQIRVEGGR